MKATARMIADRLGVRLVEARIPEDAYQGYETVRVLLPHEFLVEPGQAYVVDSNRLCTLSVPDPTSLLLCPLVSAPPDCPFGCSVLFFHGSVGEAYQAALTVLAAYAALEEELSEGLLEDWDIHRTLAACARFFGNPVQVYAPVFNILAGERPLFAADGTVCGTELFEPTMAPDLAFGLARSSDLRDALEERRAHYNRYPFFDFGCYQVNLFDGDRLVGRLVVIGQYRPFTPGVADTLDAVAKYVRHYMVHRRAALSAGLFTVEYFVSEVLGGRVPDERFLTSQLSAISWPVRDSFAVLFFCLPPQALPPRELPAQDLASYHVQALGELLRHAVVVAMDGGVAAVFRTKNLHDEQVDDLLAAYLAKADLRAGLSEPFTDFHAARACFLQAQAAVALDAGQGETSRVARYRDLAVDHLVDLVVESGCSGAFVHPAIARVEAHDRATRSDLLATLRTYLEVQGNQVAAARRLHIHRNSMKYRLQRLNELTGLDLGSTDQHLRLLLSIQIRERERRDVPGR